MIGRTHSRRGRSSSLGFVAAVAVCGGLLALVGGASSAGGQKPSCTKKLHGTLRVRNLRIWGCKDYLVTSTLRIVATGDVTIDAPIELAHGAGFIIQAAGRIVNDGPIGPAASDNRTTLAPAKPVANCRTHNISETGSGSVVITEPVTAASGGTLADGRGCPGSSIEVRSNSTSGRGGQIEVHALLRAGDGGGGGSGSIRAGKPVPCHAATAIDFSANRAPAAESVAFAKAGDGGPGGDVTLVTSAASDSYVHAPGRLVRAGDGGRGGTLGGPPPVGPKLAPDGATGHDGGSIVALSGDGGNGGSGLEVNLALNDRRRLGVAGDGGGPGSAYVKAGSGGGSNCNGGQAIVGIGELGHQGMGATVGSDDPGKATVELYGGNASPGPSTDLAHPSGGSGGQAYVFGRSCLTCAPYADEVFLNDYGNGGEGFNGCSVTPVIDGGTGGNGSNVDTHGPLLIADGSANGGNGGDGHPAPGDGGSPGTPADGVQADNSFDQAVGGSDCAAPLAAGDSLRNPRQLGKSRGPHQAAGRAL